MGSGDRLRRGSFRRVASVRMEGGVGSVRVFRFGVLLFRFRLRSLGMASGSLRDRGAGSLLGFRAFRGSARDVLFFVQFDEEREKFFSLMKKAERRRRG